MGETSARLDDLKQIRSTMEKSSTFLSLSGFSGVIVGIIGIAASILIARLYPC
jgi:predicted lysophospholipase L1 biosynthesis ABC-type transport system permease subunit